MRAHPRGPGVGTLLFTPGVRPFCTHWGEGLSLFTPGVRVFLCSQLGWGPSLQTGSFRALWLTLGQRAMAVPRPGHPARLLEIQEGLVGVSLPGGSIFVPREDVGRRESAAPIRGFHGLLLCLSYSLICTFPHSRILQLIFMGHLVCRRC